MKSKAYLRKARISDVKQIQALVNDFAKKDIMLPRSLSELYENIRDLWVFEESKVIIACSALHVLWDDLAEIKSLAVKRNKQNLGLGRELVEHCINEAKQLGVKKVFVLTYKPEFFKKFGFKRIKNSDLPQKIWVECINCCKFPNCQEIALQKIL